MSKPRFHNLNLKIFKRDTGCGAMHVVLPSIFNNHLRPARALAQYFLCSKADENYISLQKQTAFPIGLTNRPKRDSLRPPRSSLPVQYIKQIHPFENYPTSQISSVLHDM